MLKYFYSFLLFCLYLSAVRAQDTIIKRNGEKIIGKILEVNPGDIKYKRFDYQAGPTFTVNKWELKYIVYNNGIKESFESYQAPIAIGNLNSVQDLSIQPAGKFYYFQNKKITEQDMLDIAWKLPDKKTKLMVKKTEENKVIKNCFRAGGIILGTIGILKFVGAFSPDNTATVGRGTARMARMAARTRDHVSGGYMLLGGLALEIISCTFYIRETRHAHFVVDLYNQWLKGPDK